MPSRALNLATLALVSAGSIGAQQAPDLGAYLMPDRAAEVALARTAAPKHVSDSATVLVLTRKGFVEAARGTNGFTCFVMRSFDGHLDDPGFWDPQTRGPNCFNQAAVRTVLPEYLKRAELIMGGVSATEMAARIKHAYAAHELPLPASGAMTFMLSPEQHLANTDPHWMPHLMFFYDGSTPSSAWGVGGVTNTLIDASAGTSYTPVLLLLIPVRRWSDGKLALPEAAKQDIDP